MPYQRLLPVTAAFTSEGAKNTARRAQPQKSPHPEHAPYHHQNNSFLGEDTLNGERPPGVEPVEAALKIQKIR